MKTYVKYSLFGLMLSSVIASNQAWASDVENALAPNTQPTAGTASAVNEVAPAPAAVPAAAPAPAPAVMEEVGSDQALLTPNTIVNFKNFLEALKEFKSAVDGNHGVGGSAVEAQLMHQAFQKNGLVDDSLNLIGDLNILANKLVQAVDAPADSGCARCKKTFANISAGTNSALNILKAMADKVDTYYRVYEEVAAKPDAKPTDYIEAFAAANLAGDLHQLLTMAINFKTADNTKRLQAKNAHQRKLAAKRPAAAKAAQTPAPVAATANSPTEVKGKEDLIK